jgi:hypothetical protein
VLQHGCIRVFTCICIKTHHIAKLYILKYRHIPPLLSVFYVKD